MAITRSYRIAVGRLTQTPLKYIFVVGFRPVDCEGLFIKIEDCFPSVTPYSRSNHARSLIEFVIKVNDPHEILIGFRCHCLQPRAAKAPWKLCLANAKCVPRLVQATVEALSLANYLISFILVYFFYFLLLFFFCSYCGASFWLENGPELLRFFDDKFKRK